MRQAERVLVDNDRTWVLCLMEAMADPGRMDGGARGDEFTRFLPLRCQGSSLLDDTGPPFRDRCLSDLPDQRVCQCLEDGCRRAGDAEIASKPSNGNVRKQGVEAALDDFAPLRRSNMAGNPRNIDLHRQDEIGVGYEGTRVVAEVHGMRRWQRQI